MEIVFFFEAEDQRAPAEGGLSGVFGDGGICSHKDRRHVEGQNDVRPGRHIFDAEETLADRGFQDIFHLYGSSSAGRGTCSI